MSEDAPGSQEPGCSQPSQQPLALRLAARMRSADGGRDLNRQERAGARDAGSGRVEAGFDGHGEAGPAQQALGKQARQLSEQRGRPLQQPNVDRAPSPKGRAGSGPAEAVGCSAPTARGGAAKEQRWPDGKLQQPPATPAEDAAALPGHGMGSPEEPVLAQSQLPLAARLHSCRPQPGYNAQGALGASTLDTHADNAAVDGLPAQAHRLVSAGAPGSSSGVPAVQPASKEGQAGGPASCEAAQCQVSAPNSAMAAAGQAPELAADDWDIPEDLSPWDADCAAAFSTGPHADGMHPPRSATVFGSTQQHREQPGLLSLDTPAGTAHRGRRWDKNAQGGPELPDQAPRGSAAWQRGEQSTGLQWRRPLARRNNVLETPDSGAPGAFSAHVPCLYTSSPFRMCVSPHCQHAHACSCNNT